MVAQRVRGTSIGKGGRRMTEVQRAESKILALLAKRDLAPTEIFDRLIDALTRLP